MGISLKSIELSNIRSHSKFTFSPANEGVTAISGPTGSGKSTLVDSLAWTLYGTKPHGVSKNSAILKEGVDLKKDKCYARAEVEVDGALLRVERRMISKAGGVKCDVWEWSPNKKDWEHRAGSAPSHAESYIRQRLKMDEKGFLTAVLVQQKQVDQLISSGPQDRAKVIEKLTGIASISSGITSARKEQNGLKKAIELTEVDESQLVSTSKELKDSEKQLKKLKKKYKESKSKLEEVKEELDEFESKVETQTSNYERTEKARAVLAEVDVKLQASEAVFEDAKKEKEEARALLPQGSRGGDFQQSLEELKALRQEVADLEGSKSYQSRKLKDAQQELKSLALELEKAEFTTLDEVEEAKTEARSRLEALQVKFSSYKDELGELRGELQQLNSAIEVVSKGDDCPTCRQSVNDVTVAVKALEAQKSKLIEKSTELQRLLAELKTAVGKEQTSESELNLLQTTMRDHHQAQKASVEADEALGRISSELKAKTVQLKSVEKSHKLLEREEENLARYDKALKRVQKVVQAIESLKRKQTAASELLKETKAPSEQKMTSLRTRLYKLQVSYQNERVLLGEQKAEARILTSSIKHLTEKEELLTAELNRHKELLRSLEVAAATLETLTEFRTTRVKTALPTIETYASELLTRFTDGKFIALKLDEKFNASVVLSSGVERPVGMLSGGELSAASIALRLSVSMMLNASDSNNLIILDEVLVSQDSDRSELILSTIKDVCKGQVVMISHGDGVAAIADKKVDLVGT